MKRGWFTYTDLCVLLEQSSWKEALTVIYQHFTKVSKRKTMMLLHTAFMNINGACEQEIKYVVIFASRFGAKAIVWALRNICEFIMIHLPTGYLYVGYPLPD